LNTLEERAERKRKGKSQQRFEKRAKRAKNSLKMKLVKSSIVEVRAGLDSHVLLVIDEEVLGGGLGGKSGRRKVSRRTMVRLSE